MPHPDPALPDSTLSGAPSQHRFLPDATLARGDLFPDFFLPDHQGSVRSFTERAKGNAIALLLDADDAALQAALALGESCNAAGLDRVAVSGGTEAVVSARATRLGVDFPLLVDVADKIRPQLRQMTGQPMPAAAVRATSGGALRPWLILLDRQQRLLAVIDGDDLIGRALALWQREPVLEPGRVLNQFAPVLIVPNVLSADDCQALMQRWERLGHEEGTVHSIINGKETERVHAAMKSRRDQKIDDPDLHRQLSSVIGRRLAPELMRAFNFQRFRFDRFLVTCYDAARGDRFRRHRDNQSPSTQDRRFALTLNLNTGDYDGGELIFPEFGNHRYSPPAGGAILFSCSLLHEALPVTTGRRFTLLSFLRA